MQELGFDFIYSSNPDLFCLFKSKAKKIDRPHLHIKMTCPKCVKKYQGKKGGKNQGCFTTSKGTLHINYVVIKITDFNKN